MQAALHAAALAGWEAEEGLLCRASAMASGAEQIPVVGSFCFPAGI